MKFLKNLRFYKRPPLYKFLTAIFSLLLVATLLLGLVIPIPGAGMTGMGSMDMTDMDVTAMGDMTELGDMAEMPGGSRDTIEDAEDVAAEGSQEEMATEATVADEESDTQTENETDNETSGTEAEAETAEGFAGMSEESVPATMGEMAGGGMTAMNGEGAESGDMAEMPAMGDMTEMGGENASMPGMSGDGDVMTQMDGMSDANAQMPEGMNGETPAVTDEDAEAAQETETAEETDSAVETGENEAESPFDEAEEITSSVSAATGVIGVLQTVKNRWIVFAIVLAVLDVFSIVMLVITGRWEKAAIKQARAVAAAAAAAEGRVYRPVQQTTKKRRKNSSAFLILPIAAMILLVLAVKTVSENSTVTEVSQTEASILSGEAVETSISTTLPGAGTLTEEDGETMTIPEGVEISAWYVSNGDVVTEGDVIAAVDKVTVLSQAQSVQNLLEELDAELAEHEEDAVDEEMTSIVSGRVKVIYAEEDVAILDTIYEYGTLMLLSIDGTMAVEIETDAALLAGDSVTVTLSDGTEETGKVERYLNGVAVITITDDGPEYEDEVTVTDEDGNVLGTGTLYIHSEVRVTGYVGTVESVDVEVEDEIEAGDTLLTITDTGYSGDFESLLSQRAALEERMVELFCLYQDGYIYASCSGVVSGLDDDIETVSAADSASDSQSVAASGLSSIGEFIVNLLSNDSDESEVALSEGNSNGNSDDGNESADDETSDSAEGGEGNSDPGDGQSDENGEDDEEIESPGYLAAVVAIDEEEGTLTLQVADKPVSVEDYTDFSALELDKLSAEDLTETVTLELTETLQVYSYVEETLLIQELSDLEVGQILLLIYDEEELVWIVDTGSILSDEEEKLESPEGGAGEGMDGGDALNGGEGMDGEDALDGMGDGEQQENQADVAGGMTASASGTTGVSTGDTTGDLTGDLTEESAMEEESASSYAVSETELLTITPQDTMTVTITVDELDILSLEVGQTAQVTLDALPGQSFEGTVTTINTSGSNSGGSSKFTVDVTIDRNDSMLVGMNASVQITLSTTEGVLTIPEAALVEADSIVYVYTSYDEETDTLGDPVEVTTGLSDGENVEILTGLSEGDTYWYSYLDTVNYSVAQASSSSTSSISFDFQSMMR